MGSFRIGFTSTTFRQYKSLIPVVKAAKIAGAQYIEWGGDIHVKSVEDARAAKKLCDEAGIKISSYGSYYTVGSKDKEKWKEICETASAMSASSVRVWLGKKDSEKTDRSEYQQLLSDAGDICGVAEKYKLTVCPECHDGTYNNNTHAILKFKNDVCAENFKTYFQSRYFNLDYDLNRIEKTFDIIENVHISYSELVREQFFRAKNKNYIDTLLNEFKVRNFGGIIMLEYTFFSNEKFFVKDMDKLKKY